MSLPVIDISTLPNLAHFTGAQPMGMFGSQQAAQLSSGSDDSIVVLATFLYETGGGTG